MNKKTKKTTKRTTKKTTPKRSAPRKPHREQLAEQIASTSRALVRPLLVRFTDEEYAWIRRAAFEGAQSCAGFIREAAIVAIGEKLLTMKPKDAAAWKADAQTMARAQVNGVQHG